MDTTQRNVVQGMGFGRYKRLYFLIHEYPMRGQSETLDTHSYHVHHVPLLHFASAPHNFGHLFDPIHKTKTG